LFPCCCLFGLFEFSCFTSFCLLWASHGTSDAGLTDTFFVFGPFDRYFCGRAFATKDMPALATMMSTSHD
jgi:hypothetical protein